MSSFEEKLNCRNIESGDIVRWCRSENLMLFLGGCEMCDCDTCIADPFDAVYVCRFLLADGFVVKYTVHYDELFVVIR